MEGTLVIKPLKAKLIRDTDTFTKMDPYCKIMIGGNIFQTEICKSGGRYNV